MISAVIKKRADKWLMILLGLLIIFGLVALTSASAPAGYDKFHDTFFFVKRQILLGLLPGLALFLILARVDYNYWQKYGWMVYLAALAMLVLVFIPGFSNSINGARSWLKVGEFTFQTSEFAKLAVIIVLAKLVSERDRDLSDWKNGLLPVLAIIAPALILILLQPDLGTMSILAVVIFVILYCARIPKSYLAILGLIGVVMVGAMVMVAPYRLQRLTTFLHPELDPLGQGYHINQAFLAIGSGGFWGLGLGHSRQKYQYLPEVSADSIFAVVAEELGFVVATGLIVLILLIGWRIIRIARNAPDKFGGYVAVGVAVWITWQSFLNIGAMAGVLPLTGVPLPLVSHGGSALVVILSALGIVANISRQTG